MPMHPKVAALFAEAQKPKHCSKTQVKALNAPTLDVVAAVQRQVAEYRTLLSALEHDDGVPDDLRGKWEHIHQGIKALARDVEAAQDATRRVTRTAIQIEEDLATAQADVERWYKERNATA